MAEKPDWQKEADERRARVCAFLTANELTIESKFIPWKQSRDKDSRNPTLNWSVTLKYKGRAILTADYSAGCAHCPSYDQRAYNSVDVKRQVAWECENGKKWAGSKPILPDTCDVIYSLVSDGRVIDCGDFESFAAEFGYNSDSREAEKIYRVCLDIGLKMRAALGSKLLDELGELYADW